MPWMQWSRSNSKVVVNTIGNVQVVTSFSVTRIPLKWVQLLCLTSPPQMLAVAKTS